MSKKIKVKKVIHLIPITKITIIIINDFKESINKSFDEAKDNIKKSLDESKNQIPRINNCKQLSRTITPNCKRDFRRLYRLTKRSNQLTSISMEVIYESFDGLVTNWSSSPESVTKTYARFVSNFADNAVSSIRLSNNIIFSNMDSWKTVLQQAKDSSRHLSNMGVNTAKTFEQNTKEVTATAKDAQVDNTTRQQQ